MPKNVDAKGLESTIDDAYKAWNSKYMVPMLELYLLSVIKQEMRYGAQLVEMAKRDLNINIKIPTVYAMLKRAIEHDFLTNDVDEEKKLSGPKSRGVARRYYTLTSDGNIYLGRLRKSIDENMKIVKKLEMRT